MKYSLTAALLALGLAGCATTEAVEDTAATAEAAAPVAEDVDAVAPETPPDCTPGDEDCDHTGTVFRPPPGS